MQKAALWSAYCLLPTAFCLLPTAFCLLPSAYCLLLTAYCLLLTAYCLRSENAAENVAPTTVDVSVALVSIPRILLKALVVALYEALTIGLR